MQDKIMCKGVLHPKGARPPVTPPLTEASVLPSKGCHFLPKSEKLLSFIKVCWKTFNSLRQCMSLPPTFQDNNALRLKGCTRFTMPKNLPKLGACRFEFDAKTWMSAIFALRTKCSILTKFHFKRWTKTTYCVTNLVAA
eukprot:4654089-Amphidinium_carterae.1